MKGTDTCGAQPKPKDFQLCFCLGTLGHLDYESQLKISKQAGWEAVGITIEGLEEYLAKGKTVEEAKALLEKNKLHPVEILAFREWVYTKGKAQMEMLDRFRHLSKISAKLGCSVLLATTRCQGSHDDALAIENFKEICRIAAEDGNRVGFEFLPHTPIDTVKKAWDIVNETRTPNGGIVLDSFHYLKGGSRLEDLKEVPIEKIFDVHIDDLKNVNPDVDLSTLSRNYRVLPGEGDFVYDEILEYLFERRYSGYYSLEVLNKDHSREDALKLAVRAKESLERLLKGYAQKR